MGESASSTRRRILFLSTDMGMGGGAEEQVIALATGLKRRGWDSLIVSMLPPSPMPPDFANSGVGLEHLNMRRGIPGPAAIWRLRRIIRRFRPDVINSQMVHANLLARATRLLQPFPILICTMQNLTMAGVHRDWSALFARLHAMTDSLAERTTAVCQAASDWCVSNGAVAPSKMITLHNGIDTARYAHDPSARRRLRTELHIEDAFVWIAAGRLEEQKDYPNLLQAIARLPAATLRVVLICGQGSQESALQAMAQSLGIAQTVRFLGLRQDIPSVLSAADAFVMSSKLEGLPLVLLQASAASLPIVATRVGGNADVVQDGVNGMLVDAKNCVALADAMRHMEALSGDARKAMGHAGQQRAVDVFDMSRILDRWEQLFATLLAERRRQSDR